MSEDNRKSAYRRGAGVIIDHIEAIRRGDPNTSPLSEPVLLELLHVAKQMQAAGLVPLTIGGDFANGAKHVATTQAELEELVGKGRT